MKKEVLILTDKPSVEKGSFDPVLFSQLLERNEKIHITICYYEDLIYSFDQHNSQVVNQHEGYDIADFDLAYIKRTGVNTHHAVTCSMHIRRKGKKCIDTEYSSSMNPTSNKLIEHMQYSLSNLPFPDTIIVTKHTVSKVVQDFNKFDYPVIMKSLTGTRGAQNYLVATKEEALRIVAESDELNFEFALQPFIPNDSDFRFLVLGFDTKLVIKRARSKDSVHHTNNTSMGAHAELIPLSEIDSSLIELANRSAEAFNRNVAGVDIMLHKETMEPFILEVNRSPQIEHGAFVTEKSRVLSEYLCSEAEIS